MAFRTMDSFILCRCGFFGNANTEIGSVLDEAEFLILFLKNRGSSLQNNSYNVEILTNLHGNQTLSEKWTYGSEPHPLGKSNLASNGP